MSAKIRYFKVYHWGLEDPEEVWWIEVRISLYVCDALVEQSGWAAVWRVTLMMLSGPSVCFLFYRGYSYLGEGYGSWEFRGNSGKIGQIYA